MSSTLHRARWLIVEPGWVLAGGAIEVARGRVVRVLDGSTARRSAARRTGGRVSRTTREHDHGDLVLAPGLVDAHAHLELSGLAGRLPRSGSFAGWIEALLAQRRARSATDLALDARAGVDRLLAGGTTLVGDVDSSGAIDRALVDRPLRARVYREVLDARDPRRTEAALASWEAPLWTSPRSGRTFAAVSPHAPYSVSQALLSALGRRARRRRLAVGIHWAETREEVEWLARGTGPLAQQVADSPHTSGLAAIAAAGLLGTRTALYHGNHPEAGDRRRVAAAGAALVHCPGSHAYFGREPFEFEPWRRAGVQIALGTDSLASNDDLDMRREMALVRAAAPGLAPATVLAMATTAGARALGLEGRAGTLAPGAWADFVAHDIQAHSAPAVLDALTSGTGAIQSVWIAGRLVSAP